MTTPQDVAVTYTGTDNPFKDRIYRSGLTFTPGQTRLVPATLAQRFLRHLDVFKEGAIGDPKPAKKAAEQGKQAVTEPEQQDDTKQVLEQQKQEQDDQRQKEDARFALLDQLDSMDKPGLIDWAKDNYKQSIPGNLGLEKVRERAKGFIDQYGAP